jgi:hypothetical protein
VEEGQCLPDQPVTAADWAAIRTALGGQELGSGMESLARADLARALVAAGGGEVRVSFRAGPAEAVLVPTRSEAAQVLAEFFELRALARLRGESLELAWHTLRPASPKSVAEGTEIVRLRRLQAAGLITGVDYWAAEARPDRDCDGARVADLLLQAARIFDPATTAERAIDVLIQAQVVSSRDYWAKNAVPGGRCAGRNVAILLRNLSRHESVIRRLPP